MFTKVLLAVAALALAVNGQASGSTTASAADATSSVLAGISPCVLACVIPAAKLNNCSFTDVPCVCGSAQFQLDAATCLSQHCTPADLAAAVALQTSQCSAAGITPTASASTPQSVPFTLSGSSTGAAASSTPSVTSVHGSTTSPPAASPSASTTKSSATSVVAKGSAVAVICAIFASVLAL